MRHFGLQSGKIIVMHLKKGEPVLETITAQFQEMNIRDAVLLSGIGSLRKLSIHYITKTSEKSVDEFLVLEDAIEIGSIQGMIIDGEPHFHMVCSAAETGQCYIGHVENGCEVQYLMELAFLVMDDERGLTRKLDENAISYIDQKDGPVQ